jgi:hypothetical protein
VEVETGGEAASLANFQRRYAERAAAFQAHALEAGLKWPQGERVARLLYVFAEPGMMAKAQGWARGQAAGLRHTFLASLPDLVSDFAGGWQNIQGERVQPFAAY